MRAKSIATAISVGALSLALSGPLFAAGNYGTSSESSSAMQGQSNVSGAMAPTQSGAQASLSSNDVEASNLLKMDVKDSQNQTLGTISDIIVDPATGQSNYVVLSQTQTGQQYLVPWSRLQWSADHKTATLDVTPGQMSTEFSAFEGIPSSSQSQQPSSSEGAAGSSGMEGAGSQ